MTHECPKTGCSRVCSRSKLACPDHWFTVSPATRRAVNATWSAYARHSGSFDAYMAARADAIEEMNRA